MKILGSLSLYIRTLLLGLTLGGTATMAAQGDQYDEADSLYAAIRDQSKQRLTIGGGQIDVVFADSATGLDRGPVLKWIRASAQAVTVYFGRFPVTHVGILVVASEGAEIDSGRTYGFDGSAIHIRVGRATDDAAFKNDWVLVHEMTHLALPDVPTRSKWLLEGNATYVEPIARAQAGQLAASEVWHWSVEGMPKGLPKPGDQGLDHTSTWGRTYWGGAMFWLLADVQISERTHGRYGLQEALRAINAASGGNGARWSAEQLMAVGDRATGTDILATLYQKMKAAPVAPNLEELFAKLGVLERDGQILFDDQAPLAAIRQRITAPPNIAKTKMP